MSASILLDSKTCGFIVRLKCGNVVSLYFNDGGDFLRWLEAIHETWDDHWWNRYAEHMQTVIGPDDDAV